MITSSKGQGCMTIGLSAKVTHIGDPSIYSVFSETARPIEIKFHMKSLYDTLAKIYTNCTDQDDYHAPIR